MLGVKCFIFSLFLWLSFGSPQDFYGASSTIDKQAEITTSSHHTNHQHLIVNKLLGTNRANWSFKTFKIPYINSNVKVQLPIIETYDHILYIEIGSIVPLKLTTRTLIFPFHTFT